MRRGSMPRGAAPAAGLTAASQQQGLDGSEMDPEAEGGGGCIHHLSETSWGEAFQICCCLSCVLMTLTIAFFMPEIATAWQNKVLGFLPDESKQGISRTSPNHHLDPRAVGTNYQFRNDTHRACAQRCFQGGAGSLFLMPLRRWTHDTALNGWDGDKWPLLSIAERELCRSRESDVGGASGDAKHRTHHAIPDVYVNHPGLPFDGRLFRHNGLVFIAEMRDPLLLDEEDGYESGESDGRTTEKKKRKKTTTTTATTDRRGTTGDPSGVRSGKLQKGHRSFVGLAGSVHLGSNNFFSRVVANAPRGKHVDTSLPTLRRAKRVLGSFDLLLIGAWERDPTQRRSLLRVLRGVAGGRGEGGGAAAAAAAVDALSDAEVAAALGMVSDPASDAPVAFPPYPSGKIGSGGVSGRGGRIPSSELDERLFAHAANMSVSALSFAPSPPPAAAAAAAAVSPPSPSLPLPLPAAAQSACPPGSARRSCQLYRMRRPPRYFADRAAHSACA